MGLFGGKGKPTREQNALGRPSEPAIRPFHIEEAMLSEVEQLLSIVEEGLGEKSDRKIRAGIRAISDRAGSYGLAERMRRPGGTSEVESGRTFIWLAAVADCAVECDDAVLPLRVFYLAKCFEDFIQPHMTMADGDDMRVSLVPSEAMAAILKASLISLPRLGGDADCVVLKLGDVPVEAWTVGKLVGERALRSQSLESTDPELFEFARELAGIST